MPKINAEQHNVGNFGFSAVGLDELEATAYTLVTLTVDTSGSTYGFSTQMEDTVKEIVKSCSSSPRADNLLLRLVKFDTQLNEVHGYVMLSQLNLADYDGVLRPGNMTALNDACVSTFEAARNFGRTLFDQDYDVNSINFVITDGLENASKFGTDRVKQEIDSTLKEEFLDSSLNILIGINVSQCKNELENFKNEVGFNEFIDIGDANQKTLAKLAQFVSQSVSSQSSAINTGKPASISISF